MRPLEAHNKRTNINMDITAEIMLDIVSQMEGSTAMRVLEVGLYNQIASQATLHKALKWLESNNFISMKVDDGDNRVRKCSLMQRGTIYLKNFQ